ncbi:unnamed protein product [Arabis nemorensis]|uniref:Uncharacterized protein n=1 Tax=Arabis nemorensis TaxID=586526 RepID=A0A565AT17_9BRAS|nr:unnamed protein product [Arabis nemorensis]
MQTRLGTEGKTLALDIAVPKADEGVAVDTGKGHGSVPRTSKIKGFVKGLPELDSLEEFRAYHY